MVRYMPVFSQGCALPGGDDHCHSADRRELQCQWQATAFKNWRLMLRDTAQGAAQQGLQLPGRDEPERAWPLSSRWFDLRHAPAGMATRPLRDTGFMPTGRTSPSMQSREPGGKRRPAARLTECRVTVGVQPENWRLTTREAGGLPVEVTVVEELGADAFFYGTSTVEGTPHDVIVRVPGRESPSKGETLHVTTDPKHVHVFNTETGERLSS